MTKLQFAALAGFSGLLGWELGKSLETKDFTVPLKMAQVLVLILPQI
jgi:hypothetical protein